MQKAMGISTRTPSCGNPSGFGCLHLRSARALGLCFPSGSRTRGRATGHTSAPHPPAQGTAAQLSPHGPSTVIPPWPGQPIGMHWARRSARPRAGLGRGLGHVSGAGSPTERRVGPRGEGQSGGGRGAVISQTQPNSAVPGALAVGRAAARGCEHSLGTGAGCTWRGQGTRGSPRACRGAGPPHPLGDPAGAAWQPRDLRDIEGSAGPPRHCGFCPSCATAEPRCGAAKPRAVPPPPRLPQSRPRAGRRAHRGAPRGRAPTLRAGLGGAGRGADQSARGAPAAARA